ncbi:hypothetical protein [Neomegalonema sp.]|uniref:hypothetical protein n=1 Tax=Neomegalonema sp. TaxID=2039713 RepID=UPI002610F273|nr:hypothetical protein [Neomegalonema sp.]MDD2869044.1 hypothetical protein [Neomegalonema sp.]
MTSLPSWLWMLIGALLGVGTRALTSRAAQRIGGGVFGRRAVLEISLAALFGAGAGWLIMRPEDPFPPHDLTRFAVLGFLAASPDLRRKDRDQGDAFFLMLLTLGALCAGLAAGVYLLG